MAESLFGARNGAEARADGGARKSKAAFKQLGHDEKGGQKTRADRFGEKFYTQDLRTSQVLMTWVSAT
jgi:hypothetical protein